MAIVEVLFKVGICNKIETVKIEAYSSMEYSRETRWMPISPSKIPEIISIVRKNVWYSWMSSGSVWIIMTPCSIP